METIPVWKDIRELKTTEDLTSLFIGQGRFIDGDDEYLLKCAIIALSKRVDELSQELKMLKRQK